jgi:quinohemoprotein ethanol dehydrogenase
MCFAALVGVVEARDATPIPNRADDTDAVRTLGTRAVSHNWPAAGGGQNGSCYSSLRSINASNVKRLGFAWQYDLTTRRGQEATPIVVDGVMYTSGTWGYVYALDARTGKEKWRYDPHASPASARNPCCDLINRGVAVWMGRVYVAAVDGKLHALDASTGRLLWVADTITDHALPYSSTGAPQIAGKVVVIGNSGGDMGKRGVRGYVSAYDLDTGDLKWRFFTVPPSPGKPFEQSDLAAAEKTWSPMRGVDFQGGGTAWDGFGYDPTLDLVYFGTSNGAPSDPREINSGGLDMLYTASIVAVHGGTGQLAWHYQTTPNDHWDYDAVQKLILAELPLGGKIRSVIMQANKNGYFYVLDRQSGGLLSAKPFTFVNWASRVDPKSGRPSTTSDAEWYTSPKIVYPSWAGGHTWNPMSYSLSTHYVYIPVIDAPAVWSSLQDNGGELKYIDGTFSASALIPDADYDPSRLRRLFGTLPSIGDTRKQRKAPVREILKAWDPVKQRVVWEHETSPQQRGYDGGVLSTAGNLVIQGRGTGELWVYAADTGATLKVLETGSHLMAAPMTYAVDGVQFVAVQAGYGGVAMTVSSIPGNSAATKYENINRLLVFRLDGGPVPKPPKRAPVAFEEPPEASASPSTVHRGELLYLQECARCHVFGPSVTPDLRHLSRAQHSVFKDIVFGGAVASTGMESFADILAEEEVEAIHAFLIDEAWKDYRAERLRPSP